MTLKPKGISLLRSASWSHRMIIDHLLLWLLVSQPSLWGGLKIEREFHLDDSFLRLIKIKSITLIINRKPREEKKKKIKIRSRVKWHEWRKGWGSAGCICLRITALFEVFRAVHSITLLLLLLLCFRVRQQLLYTSSAPLCSSRLSASLSLWSCPVWFPFNCHLHYTQRGVNLFVYLQDPKFTAFSTFQYLPVPLTDTNWQNHHHP